MAGPGGCTFSDFTVANPVIGVEDGVSIRMCGAGWTTEVIIAVGGDIHIGIGDGMQCPEVVIGVGEGFAIEIRGGLGTIQVVIRESVVGGVIEGVAYHIASIVIQEGFAPRPHPARRD